MSQLRCPGHLPVTLERLFFELRRYRSYATEKGEHKKPNPWKRYGPNPYPISTNGPWWKSWPTCMFSKKKSSSCESLTLSRSRCIRRSISMVFQVFHATLLVLLLICQTWAIVQLPIDHLHPDNVGLRRLDGFNGFWNRQNGKTYWMHRIQNGLIGAEESIFSWNFRV